MFVSTRGSGRLKEGTAERKQKLGEAVSGVDLTCWACAAGKLKPFMDLGQLPAQVGTRWPSAEAAKSCPRGRINLAYCPTCSFVANVAFRPEEIDYGSPYDNYLGHSPTFQQFENDLARRLVDTYGIRDKRVLEIGCGLGGTVRAVCAAGHNRGWGYDPSIIKPGLDAQSGIEFVRGYYPNGGKKVPADLIICRQVFEHMPQPLAFLRSLRLTLADDEDAVLYFEVPSFDDVLRKTAVWMMIYEHCCHFGRESLAGIFARCGFDVLDIRECYDDTFVSVEARPSRATPGVIPSWLQDAEPIGEQINAFIKEFEKKRSVWGRRIQELARSGKRAVAWGAGARAVSFFNLLDITNEVPYVVDISPTKASCYLPGTGQKIVSPGFLAEYRPDVVIVINSIYREEIKKMIGELDLKVEYLCP